MYRLIGLKSVSQNNFKLLTSIRNENIFCEFKSHRCFCGVTGQVKSDSLLTGQYKTQNILHTTLTTTSNRNLSLQTLRILKLIKKKKKNKTKNYTELLQVTEDSTKEKKTTVKQLKAHKLSQFINETRAPVISNLKTSSKSSSLVGNKFDLDTLQNADVHDRIFEERPILFIGKNFDAKSITPGSETLKEILHSYNTFKELSLSGEYGAVSAPLAPEDHYLAEEEHGYEDEVDIDITKSEKSKKVKPVFKSKHHLSPELERQAKEASLLLNLQSFIETSVNCGMHNRALITLQNYRYKSREGKYKIRLVDIKLYNSLIHGFAANGNLNKVRDVLGIMNEENVVPIPQTYAGVFECLGRLVDSAENLEFIQNYYEEAKSRGITLNDILDKSKFVYDQREIVIDVLHKIDPNFVQFYTPPVITYSNRLLNNLNDVEPIVTEKLKTDRDCKIMNSKRGFSYDELKEMNEAQLKIELDGMMTVKSIEKFPPVTETVKHYRKNLVEFEKEWRLDICRAFNRDFHTTRHQIKSKGFRSINLLPYLKALDVNQYADILLKEIRILSEGSETYSPTLTTLYRELGQKSLTRYQIEMKKRNGVLDKTKDVYDEYCKTLEKCDSNDNPRQLWQRIIYNNQNSGADIDVNVKAWPMSAIFGVGQFLFNILMRDIKIDINCIRQNSKTENLMPAFYTLFRNHGRKVKEELKPHPILSKLYRGSQQQNLVFESNMVPMMCPPQPWSTPQNGGYIITKADLIRLPHQAVQQLSRVNETPIEKLYPALDSLNQLASIPWKVNSQLLDVILEVFNNGGSVKLDVPEHPNSLPPIENVEDKSTLTKQDKFKYMQEKLVHRRRQGEMYSLWCDALYRLSLANHFRDKVFWLPHNMDFRGRVYPIPPHLNHLGSDLARSLLIFHQPQPLGPDGFNWLKLHCINLTGLKKRDSVVERLLFAEEVMDEIIDSAENPLTGRMWWAKSDEPWQTLGCCMEIAKVLKCDNPEEFLSSFPIHQDGSCNGLQHYAALGRDTAGAISVNLAPSEIPQDVYSAVAVLVENTRQSDAEKGIEVAKILNGFIKRKVIKQTVMTTVYGVTRYGARLQIARQLKDLDSFPKSWVWSASFYLTNKTFDSLREMFTSTKEIQDWFTDCAKLISGTGGHNVEWITPLGLPVVQPYSRFEKQFRSKTHRVDEQMSMDQYEKPNIMKQRNAFPPNFIHSLDSSHMMLTSLHCEKAGLTFISVHDCFWTHACSVADMNKICREQFVALHSEPILEDLSDFLSEKYSYSHKDFNFDGSVKDLSKQKLNKILKQLPQKGDFDLNNILRSTYFFS